MLILRFNQIIMYFFLINYIKKQSMLVLILNYMKTNINKILN